MSDYQLSDSGFVVRLSDNAHIPADPANRDWVEYQAWLEADNTPDPAPAEVSATRISSAEFQARFTDPEQAAIWAAAAADATGAIGAGLTKGLTAGTIDLTSPVLAGWLDLLVSAGAISAGRKATLVTP